MPADSLHALVVFGARQELLRLQGLSLMQDLVGLM
jgi:hypothetical protein